MIDRKHIVDTLDTAGLLMGCGYIDKDTVSAFCPLCDGPMAVRFATRSVTFDCRYHGCDEDRIARILFDVDTAAADQAHRDRLVGLLVNAACRVPADSEAQTA